MATTRRGLRGALTAVLLLCLVALGLTACSSPEADEAAAPVQINLPDGRQVTIDGIPKRIVTLGGQWTDIALAFGVTPVGYYDAMKAMGGETAPWYGDSLESSTAVDMSGDAVGQIAALEPDLILAPGFADMAGNFDKLSKLAPTLSKISGEQIDPWRDMVTLLGTVLHQPEKAQEITDRVDKKIQALADEYPTLKDKTYAFAYMYGADQIQVLGDQNDGAAELFTQLGMKIAPKLVQQSQQTGQPRFPISAENLNLLDADLLVIAAQTPELRERLESLPGYRNLASVKAGAVSLLSPVQITGINEPSPGSISYVLEQLRPALAAAAKE